MFLFLHKGVSAGLANTNNKQADKIDIKKMASAAKIWLSDIELDEMQQALAPLLAIAQSIADVDDSSYQEGVDDHQAEATISITASDSDVMTLSALRSDTPTSRETSVNLATTDSNDTTIAERLIEQSPTAEDNGFTIPKLLE